MKQFLFLIPFCALGQVGLAQEVDTLKVRQLETVSVLGTRATTRTPIAYSDISKEELRKRNLGEDLPFLLQLQPSIVATSDAGTGIGYTALRVRGVDATGINITLGGVPINDSESGAVFWVNMPDLASSLGQIQIQRGVGTSSNGAASFGASINMSTEHLSMTPFAEVGLSAGSYGAFRRNIRLGTGRLAGHWAVEARLSKITNDGYINRSGVDLSSYFIQGAYFNNSTVVKYISFGGKEITGIAWDGISAEDIATYGRRYNFAGYRGKDSEGKPLFHRDTDNYKQQHHHLVLSHRFAPELSLNLTAHYTKGFGYTNEYQRERKFSAFGLENYTNPSTGELIKRSDLIRRKYLDNDFYGLVTTINYSPDRWAINLGLSANRYEGMHYGEVRWIASYNKPVYPEQRYYESDARKDILSSHIKASYQLSDRLSAYVDLQYRYVGYWIGGTYDKINESTNKLQGIDLAIRNHFFNPKAGLHYQLDKHNQLYASVAIASREPNRKNYTDAASPEHYPRPERLTDYELGYSYRSERLSLSAGTYYMHYRDQLVPNGKISDVGAALLENVPNSYRMGLELQGSVQPINYLTLSASLALSCNRIKAYDYAMPLLDASGWETLGTKLITYVDSPIAYSPIVVASGIATFSKAGFEASLLAQHVGRQYLDNTGNEARTLPSYTLLGLHLGYDIPLKLAKRWNVSLQINNLLNREYASNAYVYGVGILPDGREQGIIGLYPQAGINFLLGTTITL